jgi:hypothetical protein
MNPGYRGGSGIFVPTVLSVISHCRAYFLRPAKSPNYAGAIMTHTVAAFLLQRLRARGVKGVYLETGDY